MPLADERASIRAGISAARKSTQLVSDLNSLESSRRTIGKLNELERKGVRPPTRGRADWKAPATGGAGGGIASPLTETAYGDRAYWPETVLTSSDGLLSFKVRPIKSIKQRDANNAEVIQQFAQPEAPS